MTSKRNKAILEEMLDKIDQELEKHEHRAARYDNKADQLLASMTNIDDVLKAPKYEVPAGCPSIYLETRAGNTYTLHVMLDCKKGIDEHKLKNAVLSLTTAKTQAPGESKLRIYFTNDTPHIRLAIERHRRLFEKNSIDTIYESALPDAKYK